MKVIFFSAHRLSYAKYLFRFIVSTQQFTGTSPAFNHLCAWTQPLEPSTPVPLSGGLASVFYTKQYSVSFLEICSSVSLGIFGRGSLRLQNWFTIAHSSSGHFNIKYTVYIFSLLLRHRTRTLSVTKAIIFRYRKIYLFSLPRLTCACLPHVLCLGF